MTSQPDSPATDRIGIDEEDAMEAEQAPTSGFRTADSRPAGTGDDLTESNLTESDRDDEYATAGGLNLATAEATGATALTGAGQPQAGLGQQWHDIQAMFVDDPRGSVELAAAAADAAVSALVETLHQRQSALAPAGSTSADPGGTEQLREALRSYRVFCQSLSEIGRDLALPAAVTP